MGISRRGLGVLWSRSGDYLGISVSGDGDLGAFAGLLGAIGLLLAVLTVSESLGGFAVQPLVASLRSQYVVTPILSVFVLTSSSVSACISYVWLSA